MIIKMRCNNGCCLVICRMLHRCKRVNCPSHWKYNNSSRMLSGRTAHANTALQQTLNFHRPLRNSFLLKIIFHITVCRLIRKCTYRTGTECLSGTKNNFRICMGFTLVFTGKVQINIRLFIPVKSKECFKRYVMSIAHKFCPTIRTFLRRHIKSGTAGKRFYLVRIKIRIMAFFTVIMCRKRIYLCDTGHCSDERRTNGTTRTNKISVLIRFPHKFLCNNIHYCKSVGNNGV